MTDNADMTTFVDSTETVVVRLAALRELFDSATGSLDFGSDFWSETTTLAAREVAAALGVCPNVATPGTHRDKYPMCTGLELGLVEWRERLHAALAKAREDYAEYGDDHCARRVEYAENDLNNLSNKLRYVKHHDH